MDLPELTWDIFFDLLVRVLAGGLTGLISLVLLASAGAAAYYKYKDKFKELMIEENKRRSHKAQTDNARDNLKAEQDMANAQSRLKRLLTNRRQRRKIRENNKRDKR